MMRIITLSFLVFLSFQLSAQSGLNNLGFENWSENNFFGNPQPTGLGSIGQTENTSDPVEGNSALSLTTKRFQTGATTYDTAGITILGEITMSGVQLGDSYTECPDSLTGSFRFNLPNQDTGLIVSQVWNSTDTLAEADTMVGGSLSSWTSFNLHFDPMDCQGMTPDSIAIIFSSESVIPEVGLDVGTQTPGTGSFELDGVELWANGSPSALSEIRVQNNEISVRPNPAKEKVVFDFGSQAERIRIFDMTGRMVKTVPIEAGQLKEVDVSGLKEGLYIYRVEDGQGRQIDGDKLQIVR